MRAFGLYALVFSHTKSENLLLKSVGEKSFSGPYLPVFKWIRRFILCFQPECGNMRIRKKNVYRISCNKSSFKIKFSYIFYALWLPINLWIRLLQPTSCQHSFLFQFFPVYCNFYTLWNHQETSSFLMFSGGKGAANTG